MFLITGDSWGCGEWQKKDNCWNLSHGGLGQYLEENNRPTINLSILGSSNQASIDRLKLFFDSGANRHLKNPLTPGTSDKIFFFQTQWCRDLGSKENNFPFDENIYHRYLSQTYYQLSKIYERYGIPIYIIGGASDTIWLEKFSLEYTGLTIACQSFTNLCINNTHIISSPYIGGIDEKAAEILKKNNPLMISTIETLIDESMSRFMLWRNHPEWFFPDGAHANRDGHKKLFKYLITNGFIN